LVYKDANHSHAYSLTNEEVSGKGGVVPPSLQLRLVCIRRFGSRPTSL